MGQRPRCSVHSSEGAEEVKLPAVRTGLARHADGLISVRATSTKCPSQELKIEDSGKAHHHRHRASYKWQKWQESINLPHSISSAK